MGHGRHIGRSATVGEDWTQVIFDYHVQHEHMAADEFDNSLQRVTEKLKGIFVSRQYFLIFCFHQFVIRHGSRPYKLIDSIEEALTDSRAAYNYKILDGNNSRSIADLAASEFHGARAHLRDAGAALIAGDHTSSVRESIHGVESVARSLWPDKLSTALASLEKSAAIHGGLKSGFLAICSYTSDEQGIRHPLIDGPLANVDETDALFMIGACASFVSYLIGKARSAGLLKKKK
jgi:hypothetical protein